MWCINCCYGHRPWYYHFYVCCVNIMRLGSPANPTAATEARRSMSHQLYTTRRNLSCSSRIDSSSHLHSTDSFSFLLEICTHSLSPPVTSMGKKAMQEAFRGAQKPKKTISLAGKPAPAAHR